MKNNSLLQKIGFGGGCHWCTEAVFQSVKGITKVRQGFIRSDQPNDTYSEAVEITFDANKVSIKSLISIHLATHASTSSHKMRDKYRSAIYIFNTKQKSESNEALSELSIETGAQFITLILWHRGFQESDERFQNYYLRKPEKPFCKTYIDPKLAKIRQGFSSLMK